MLDNSRRLHLGDAADATRHALTGFVSGMKAAFALPFEGLQSAFQPSARRQLAERQPALVDRQPVQAEGQPVVAERQPKAAVLEAGPLPAGATVRVSVRSSQDEEVGMPVEARLAGIQDIRRHQQHVN